mmetsp:Transcript_11107/g.15317  ORF Transcript_11107/g.15317 Transcript_11107/m.15317 type:complete len:111 (+) Transcript_11107:215-547(+)
MTISITILQQPLTPIPQNYIVVDWLHFLCTFVDILYLSEERLTASNQQEQNRRCWWDICKLLALGLLSWIFLQSQLDLTNWGYLVFVVTSTCLSDLVHFILENTPTVRHG